MALASACLQGCSLFSLIGSSVRSIPFGGAGVLETLVMLLAAVAMTALLFIVGWCTVFTGKMLARFYWWVTDPLVPNINPNYFTVARPVFAVTTFALLASWPIFYAPWTLWAALASWLGGYFTDHWDGRIARKHGWITPFGEDFDPYADAVNCLGVYVGFYAAGILGPADLWMLFLMVFRDYTTNFLRSRAKQLGERLPARKSGKIKAVLQWIGSFVIFMATFWFGIEDYDYGYTITWWTMCIVAGYTFLTGIEYTWACRHFFNGEFTWRRPAHAETVKQKHAQVGVPAK